jgi:hypothetical protein
LAAAVTAAAALVPALAAATPLKLTVKPMSVRADAIYTNCGRPLFRSTVSGGSSACLSRQRPIRNAATNSTGNTTAASTSAAPTPKPAVSTVKLSATRADLFKALAQPRPSRPILDAIEMPAHAASTDSGTVIAMSGGLRVNPSTGSSIAFASSLEPTRLTTLSTSASRAVSPDRRERAPGKLVRDDMNTSSQMLRSVVAVPRLK